MEKQYKNIDDAYKWSIETVEALRAGDFSRIDMDELINEIGSIASGLRRELLSLLSAIIESLLVIDYTNGDKEEADRKLVGAQAQLQLVFHATPSLREALDECVTQAYRRASSYVAEDYAVKLPDRCPISLQRIVEDPYDRVVAEARRS